MCTNTLPRSGGLLVATHPDVAPVTAGMISNFAKKLFRLKSSHMITFWKSLLSSPIQNWNCFKLFCSLGKKKFYTRICQLFYRGFLKLLLMTGKGAYSWQTAVFTLSRSTVKQTAPPSLSVLMKSAWFLLKETSYFFVRGRTFNKLWQSALKFG